MRLNRFGNHINFWKTKRSKWNWYGSGITLWFRRIVKITAYKQLLIYWAHSHSIHNFLLRGFLFISFVYPKCLHKFNFFSLNFSALPVPSSSLRFLVRFHVGLFLYFVWHSKLKFINHEINWCNRFTWAMFFDYN